MSPELQDRSDHTHFVPYVAKKGEAYMNPDQEAHFLSILNAWRQELMEEVDRTVDHMKVDSVHCPDPNDRATQEADMGMELRTRDRERKLLRKIHAALARIEDGSYGLCRKCGEAIPDNRLQAVPYTSLCVSCAEKLE